MKKTEELVNREKLIIESFNEVSLKLENQTNKVLVTPEHLRGMTEIYTTCFNCPKCETLNICDNTKFCRTCGVNIIFSQTVRKTMGDARH